ncbi:MAG: GAF domain-containing protein [Anaerolineae bacterium]|nr:GAF domain-containing protein [Anaerolineae bacterium]
MSSHKKILVVSGDYDLLHQARQSLTDLGFSFQGAFSHRDALYAMRNHEYDAIFVHALMADQRSGEYTARHLRDTYQRVPMIVYVPENVPADGYGESADHVVTNLDEGAIRHAVLQVLHYHTAPIMMQTIQFKGRDDSEYWDVDEVQTFLALTRSLTEVLDLHEVLSRVVIAARQLTDAEEGMILLPDGDSPELYLRARVGMDNAVARNFRVKTSDTLAGQVFRTGQPVLVGQRGPLKVKTQYFVNAILYVPILLQGQTLGVLGVNNRTKHDVFNGHHETLLLNLAAYAAIAIENARIHEQSMRRARELRALVDASEAINATLSVDHTLSATCEQIVRVLGLSQAEILEYDRIHACLRPRARYSRAIWRPGHEPRLALTECPALAHALSDGQPQLVRVDRSPPSGERDYVAQSAARAMVAMPIMGDEHLFGVLLAFYKQAPRRMPATEQFVTAQYLAMEALLELLDKERVFTSSFQRIVDEINTLCGSDWCEAGLLTNDGADIDLHFRSGSATWIADSAASISIAEFADLREALETQNIINQHVEGEMLTPGVHHLLQTTNGRSLLALPLNYRGQTQGAVLCLDMENSRPFPVREVDLGRAVVGQAATALENAELHSDLGTSLEKLQAAQEMLIQQERLSAMGELAAAVAHQVNNPLTTIVLDTELMMLQEPSDSERYQALLAIARSGKRAASVMRRLLSAVRPQADETPPVPIQVITTIEDTIALVKSHIERDGLRIVTQLPSQPVPPVVAVPGELEDVWLNLLLNAHDALVGYPKPVIRVTAEYDADESVLRVTIADNGPGISEDVQSHIFDAFFTTKPVGVGTGLGLHICRQFVQRAGGRITVQSTPGKGARFAVDLPVQKGD